MRTTALLMYLGIVIVIALAMAGEPTLCGGDLDRLVEVAKSLDGTDTDVARAEHRLKICLNR